LCTKRESVRLFEVLTRGSDSAIMKKAHPPSGWAFCSVNDLVYFLPFFAVAFFAAPFGFAAFAFVAIDSTPPSNGRATQ